MWNYTSTPPYAFKAHKGKTSPYLESVMPNTLLTTHLILWELHSSWLFHST